MAMRWRPPTLPEPYRLRVSAADSAGCHTAQVGDRSSTGTTSRLGCERVCAGVE
jgi:hypothetical protein